MAKLNVIEGIGNVSRTRLETAGVDTVEKLLELGKTQHGRQSLSGQTGLSSRRILNWVNRADLARVNGIGEEYADLLEAAGVSNVPNLAEKDATHLHARLKEVNNMKRLVRRVPAISRVSNWVQQARELPAVIEY